MGVKNGGWKAEKEQQKKEDKKRGDQEAKRRPTGGSVSRPRHPTRRPLSLVRLGKAGKAW